MKSLQYKTLIENRLEVAKEALILGRKCSRIERSILWAVAYALSLDPDSGLPLSQSRSISIISRDDTPIPDLTTLTMGGRDHESRFRSALVSLEIEGEDLAIRLCHLNGEALARVIGEVTEFYIADHIEFNTELCPFEVAPPRRIVEFLQADAKQIIQKISTINIFAEFSHSRALKWLWENGIN